MIVDLQVPSRSQLLLYIGDGHGHYCLHYYHDGCTVEASLVGNKDSGTPQEIAILRMVDRAPSLRGELL